MENPKAVHILDRGQTMLHLSVPVCVCLPSLKEKLELLLQNRSGTI